MSNKDFKIDFIGIGVSRSATTWIFQSLKEHPQICGASKKEIIFFGDNFREKGIQYYSSFFEHCSDNSIKGEFSPGYFRKERVPNQIRSVFPEIKLIISLRNPIERAVSHYKLNVEAGGRLTIYDNFEQAVKKQPEFLVERGYYYKYLKKFFEIFPEENIYVVLYNEIKQTPLKAIQGIYRFLDVDDKFKPPSSSCKRNASGKVKAEYRSTFIHNFLYRIMEAIPLKSRFYNVLESLGLIKKGRNLLKRYNRKKKRVSQNQKEITVSRDLRKQLLKTYRKDIEKLEQLIDKDLSHWKKP